MKKITVQKTDEYSLGYILYTPETITENTPLIVFLHGAGERGNGKDELDLVNVHALPQLINEGCDYPAFVLCPQCPKDFVWNNQVYFLKKLIDEIKETYPIGKIAITGISMGGYGTWEMGMCYPDFFSCIAPVCGGGLSWRTETLKDMKIWAFHGDADSVVPCNNSYEMVDKVNQFGGNAKLTIFHNVDHDSWNPAYRETKLIDWLLENTK